MDIIYYILYIYIKYIAGDILSPVPLPAECCANFLPPVGQGKPQPQPAIFWGFPQLTSWKYRNPREPMTDSRRFVCVY